MSVPSTPVFSFRTTPLPTALTTGNTTHRVLTIPELLTLIFNFTTPSSNANNACVCKTWSDIALAALWSEVHDLHRLLSLLVPLKKRVRDMLYELVRTPQSTDYLRFARYARLVRRLHYNVHSPMHKHLHHSVFDEIARTRLQLDILPNLNSLEWITEYEVDLRMSVVFMHERVRKLVVWLPFAGSVDEGTHDGEGLVGQDYFQEISARMPNLTHLDLRMRLPIRFIHRSITTSLFPLLPRLQTLVLPNYHLSSPVLATLSRLPNLGTIQFEYGPDQGVGDITDVQHLSPQLEEGAFPGLWDLSLTASLGDMVRFMEMNSRRALANLTSLYVDCPRLQHAEDVFMFLKSVGEHCQVLKALYLELLWMDSSSIYPPRDDRITFETLQPLFACPKLTEFTLTHDHPVDITQDQIETLTSKWPTLETFILACEPIKLNSPTLTLLALLPFARHCPSIRTLGLFINASTADLPTIFSSSGSNIRPSGPDIPRFQKLSKLSMGVSQIQDEGTIALFLSHLCPIGCEIECGVTWHTDLEEMAGDDHVNEGACAELIAEVGKRCTKWDAVGGMLPLLTRLRVEERERSRALGDEVEDLRIRNRILMERGKKSLEGDGACVIF